MSYPHSVGTIDLIYYEGLGIKKYFLIRCRYNVFLCKVSVYEDVLSYVSAHLPLFFS